MSLVYKQQSSNIVKTYILMAIFLVVIIAIGYFASIYYGSPNILYFAVVFSLIMNFMSFWFSDKIVLSLSNAKPVSREEFFDLYNTVENLSITAGLPVPKIYVIDDPAPNAFATGRDKNHAVVAVTTGLLQKLNKTELEGVVAHELSHIGNRDILLMSATVVLVGFISILSDMLLRGFFLGDRKNKGGVFVIISIVLMILSPIIATLIKLAISRKREYLADASAVLLTRYPDGLASALEKISEYSMPMKNPHTATAHLFISNPFEKNINNNIDEIQDDGGFSLPNLFETHPPIKERIKILREMRNY